MNKPQAMIFGEVLFDCFPDNKQILGGAPFNVAWNLQALGIAPIFLSRVGDDSLGHQILQAMFKWGMNAQGVQRDEQHPTGMVSVTFHNNEPSYDIVRNSAWDFIEAEQLQIVRDNKLLYHGTLALRHEKSAEALKQIKKQQKGRVFLDVNLRDPYWNKEQVRALIKDCDYLKLNQDELERLAEGQGNLQQQAANILVQFNLQQIYVTLGAEGAFSVDGTGNVYHVHPDQDCKLVDTVGAGDAFASVLITGILKNWDTQLTLNRAQAFAGAVVGLNGAGTEDKRFYHRFTEAWQK